MLNDDSLAFEALAVHFLDGILGIFVVFVLDEGVASLELDVLDGAEAPELVVEVFFSDAGSELGDENLGISFL